MWRCRDPEVLCHGPAGTGKTRAILEKAFLFARKHPRCRVLLARKTRASMTQSVLVTFEEKVLPEEDPLRMGPTRATRSAYKLPNGSEIVIAGLDEPSRIMSTEYDLACVFEATEVSEQDWEMVQTRLRNHVAPYQQGIADCNPAGPAHWLIVRVEKGLMRGFQSTHADNPALDGPEGQRYLAQLAKLTGHRRARLFEGRWAAAEGLVYPLFRDRLVDHFTVPPESSFVGGVDFGWNDPFAAIGAAHTPDDRLFVFYERYKSKVPLDVHATALRRVHRGPWYCDTSRPDEIHDLIRADVAARPARKSIPTGIAAVNARLATERLFVHVRCRALTCEADSYGYDLEDSSGEKPVGGFEHALDALRYLVMGLDRLHLAGEVDAELTEARRALAS